MKLHEAIGLELERREMEITFEFACRDDCLGKMVPSDLRQVVAERDRLRERNEALEKDFAYHSELCTIQQARIDELEGALTAAYQEGWEAGKDTCVVDGDFSHDFKDSSTKALLGGEG